MSELFEVEQYDAAGRLGRLEVPRAGTTIQTPALLPVVNPHVQTVPPAELESQFGAEILITNSYVLHGSDELREPALEGGLHDLLDFSGAIMTDSGSFQLSEYGEIDVTTEEILEFQREIGSDIGTPIDIPTPPDVPREQAAEEQRTTQERIELAETVDTGEMLVTAPIQGSTHLDIRQRAAREAYGTDLDLFPIGAMVPLMNEYRFDDLVHVVAAAKRGLGEDAPVHLFGAGHPMMFALAAAMGCDLFDSAAYALYARDGRYLTVRGTEHLDELEHFPCECSVCLSHTPEELRQAGETERHRLLAEHNLAVSFGEIRRVRQAIRGGNLLELVDARARGHPAMLDGYRTLLHYADQLRRTDPVAKDAFFYVSGESARRPEVRRHHERLGRLDAPDRLRLSVGSPGEDGWRLVAPFGPVPPALSDVYPLTAARPDSLERPAYAAAVRGVNRLAAANPDTAITVVHDGWPEDVLASLPGDVSIRLLGGE
ncbi:tRNA guanosine(15) transglycosylase TgtA [Halovenus sp. WSH3]|uniref:tRNA-guanine(15) transglycosylase n=1 Tax=Halovenus carboxidivorans TaxID=2692199 RepID=A0A6B0T5R8_9EURY|nr:tRNA guanosine(15) transglycosylase TgtA [Halovenus carboxidivorans]MXR50571.1 tRNA guanosine(15) transglycosylase TgtA [Halovenus carboxidivorans]